MQTCTAPARERLGERRTIGHSCVQAGCLPTGHTGPCRIIQVNEVIVRSNVFFSYVRSTNGQVTHSVTVRTLNVRSRGRGLDSRSGRYEVVSTWMGDCLWTGKPSRYITNTKINSAFHPSAVGKSSTGLLGCG